MGKKVFLLNLVFLFATARSLTVDTHNEEEANVVQIKNQAEFDELVSSSISTDSKTDDGWAIIEFVASWCGHCRKLQPEFAAAAEMMLKLTDKIKFGRVDCEASRLTKSMCRQTQRIFSFPTVRSFRNNTMIEDYPRIPRNAGDIMEYVASVDAREKILSEKALLATMESGPLAPAFPQDAHTFDQLKGITFQSANALIVPATETALAKYVMDYVPVAFSANANERKCCWWPAHQRQQCFECAGMSIESFVEKQSHLLKRKLVFDQPSWRDLYQMRLQDWRRVVILATQSNEATAAAEMLEQVLEQNNLAQKYFGVVVSVQGDYEKGFRDFFGTQDMQKEHISLLVTFDVGLNSRLKWSQDFSDLEDSSLSPSELDELWKVKVTEFLRDVDLHKISGELMGSSPKKLGGGMGQWMGDLYAPVVRRLRAVMTVAVWWWALRAAAVLLGFVLLGSLVVNAFQRFLVPKKRSRAVGSTAAHSRDFTKYQ